MVAVLLSWAASAVYAQAAGPVRLADEAETWRLSNGLVELTVDQKQATVTHLAVPGGPEMISLGYYDTNGRPGGFEKSAGYERFGRHTPVIAEVAHQSEDMVDVLLRTDTARTRPDFNHPLLCELHVVVRRGDPGFYVYWLRWHDPGMAPFGLGQTRYVIVGERAVFDRWQITDDRRGVFPTAEEMKAAKAVYDATLQLPDGRYVTKYANAVEAAGHHLSGLYSTPHKLGLWQINASREYINGGPTKQNLTLYEEVPILLHMTHSGHFSRGGVKIQGEWAKLYGPVFFYVNQGRGLEDLWQDAKQRTREEQSRWPYAWVKPQSVPDAYPLARGTVKGHVKRADGKSPAGAFAVLAAPDPEWPFQGLGYMFWQRVGENVLSLKPPSPRMWVMYDFLRLEDAD